MARAKHEIITVPDYIDEAARTSANDTWAIVPKSTTGLDQGWQHLSYTDLARAVDSFAWWIEKTVGVSKHQGQTIGYMGYVVFDSSEISL